MFHSTRHLSFVFTTKFIVLIQQEATRRCNTFKFALFPLILFLTLAYPSATHDLTIPMIHRRKNFSLQNTVRCKSQKLEKEFERLAHVFNPHWRRKHANTLVLSGLVFYAQINVNNKNNAFLVWQKETKYKGRKTHTALRWKSPFFFSLLAIISGTSQVRINGKKPKHLRSALIFPSTSK